MKKKVKKTTKKVAKKPAKKAVKKGAAAKTSTVKTGVGVQPLADRVLVRPLSSEEMGTTTSFGIIIPDTAQKEKPEQGIVVAVGDGKLLDDGSVRPVEVSEGDRVMFSKYGFDEVKVGGVEYYIISESNVLAKISS